LSKLWTFNGEPVKPYEERRSVMAKAEKILVVDDERGIRYLLSDVLSDAGFEVSMAKDGQESLDQLKGNRFALVVTDINMPRLDGI